MTIKIEKVIDRKDGTVSVKLTADNKREVMAAIKHYKQFMAKRGKKPDYKVVKTA